VLLYRRLLAEETQSEQRALLAEREGRHQLERSLLSEVERLQRQVDLAKQTSEHAAQCGEELRREVSAHAHTAHFFFPLKTIT